MTALSCRAAQQRQQPRHVIFLFNPTSPYPDHEMEFLLCVKLRNGYVHPGMSSEPTGQRCVVCGRNLNFMQILNHPQLNSEALYHVSAHSSVLNDAVSAVAAGDKLFRSATGPIGAGERASPGHMECRSEVGEAPPLMTCEAVITTVT